MRAIEGRGGPHRAVVRRGHDRRRWLHSELDGAKEDVVAGLGEDAGSSGDDQNGFVAGCKGSVREQLERGGVCEEKCARQWSSAQVGYGGWSLCCARGKWGRGSGGMGARQCAGRGNGAEACYGERERGLRACLL